MSPLAARLDRFVRWFFNSSPTASIERPSAAKGEPTSRAAGSKAFS